MRIHEILTESRVINEGARIDHAEDLVFWEGSRGAKRALKALHSLASQGHKKTTVKWDGSPAVIFGRDENGEFIFTDKAGFGAKGYDGKSRNAQALETMLLSRGKEVTTSRRAFAANMRSVFDYFKNSVPEDLRGFYKGDLLYFDTPSIQDGKYVFKPNLVTYRVPVDSDLGKKISRSRAGIVLHRFMDFSGNETPLKTGMGFIGEDILMIPPVFVKAPVKINAARVAEINKLISGKGSSIDRLLNAKQLADKEISDFSTVLYTYLNSKVDTGLSGLGQDFTTWLSGSKVSKSKQSRILEHIAANKTGMQALWQVVTKLMALKDNIISDLDKQGQDVEATVGEIPGGEGYVLSHTAGDIKLVNRAGFSAANRAIKRE